MPRGCPCYPVNPRILSILILTPSRMPRGSPCHPVNPRILSILILTPSRMPSCATGKTTPPASQAARQNAQQTPHLLSYPHEAVTPEAMTYGDYGDRRHAGGDDQRRTSITFYA